ncbi:MAG: pilus (MSHA type) biogenesis protein MshL [Gammaproteobacteria bacterium]|nr:pilus (MSHA type) biogenesis protein MshL [Gammaproteobacteria bacterium]
MKHHGYLILLISAIFLLSSCTIHPPKNSNPEDQINKALQSSIHTNKQVDRKAKNDQIPGFLNQALTPGMPGNVPTAGKANEQRFNIAVHDVPAKDFFIGLVKGSKKSMMVSPEVDGTISLNLKNVTVPEVLDAVRDTYGYEYKVTTYGYDIFPRSMQTKMFTVNYLDINRVGKSYTTISSGEISRKISSDNDESSSDNSTTTETDTKPSSSVESDSNFNFWKTLKTSVDTIVGDKKGSTVLVNPQAGIIIVHAYPGSLREVAKYLDSLQNIMGRQVIIEARVLEVELSARYQAGVDWKVLGASQTGSQNFDPNIASMSNIFTLNVSGGDDFNAVINLLNAQGKVNVLSSPRIATMNNQKAIIKVGEDSFFVTNVDSDVTATDLTGDAVISQDIDLTPFFSGIALDVTPQIDKGGEVTLHIHPIISQVREQDKKFTVNGKEQDLPLAQSDVRESDSVVRAQSGQVIVIGGLMETRASDYNAGTPGAEDLPNVGGLFRSTNKSSGKFELIILLRPIVIKKGTWTKQLQKSAHENSSMQGDFGYTQKIKLNQQEQNNQEQK